MKLCRGKISYTKKDAETARNRRLRSKQKSADYLRIYPCHRCNGWHLTSKESP